MTCIDIRVSASVIFNILHSPFFITWSLIEPVWYINFR